ncbi:MAG: hypothetical protein HQ589_00330 [Syntrophaceae bacterium]|nr:hypothetical protein [Syntrophaceae bacterium]
MLSTYFAFHGRFVSVYGKCLFDAKPPPCPIRQMNASFDLILKANELPCRKQRDITKSIERPGGAGNIILAKIKKIWNHAAK